MQRTIPGALSLLMLMGLGACSTNSDEIPTGQLADAKQAQVEKLETQFVVPAGRGKSELAANYRSGFDRFILEAGGTKPELVHLTLFGGVPQVATALRAAAIADGVDPTKIEIQPTGTPPSGGAAAGQTTAVATTYHVRLPSCATRPTDAFTRDQNPAWSDFGCSVNGTLAAMVADPRDLLQGRGGGETDSAISGAAIDRLLQDKVKKFDTQSFTAGGGSSGAQP